LIPDKDGQPVVAIVGGVEKGMELWNPRTHTVELLWDEIPPEEGGREGLRGSGLVPLSGGEEFILYGGYQGSIQRDIWKYISSNNTWIRYYTISLFISSAESHSFKSF
jgi:hypothetical protein